MGLMKGGGGGGEIVQVQGGHIVRSTGRKDRHSKVYTSKGARDRRVRLSAHTAIQFYDVQDRLGFDRPSKAVDWLIKKAKSSIDKLADLPPWNPTISTSIAGPTTAAAATPSSGELTLHDPSELPGGYPGAAGSSSFLSPPPQMDDSDTMKLFFPTSNSAAAPPSITFTGYSVPPDMVARTAHQSEDLGLSLHSFQDNSDAGLHSSSSRAFFLGTTPVDAFESNYPRTMGWGGDAGTEESRGGSAHGFGVGSALMMVNQQRGPLQSSFAGGFNELSIGSMPSDNHHHHHKPPAMVLHQSSFFGGRFGSDSLTGFYFPARVHGNNADEEHVGPRSLSCSLFHKESLKSKSEQRRKAWKGCFLCCAKQPQLFNLVSFLFP